MGSVIESVFVFFLFVEGNSFLSGCSSQAACSKGSV